MPKKNHCDKHYRFVATCPDCQASNEEKADSKIEENLKLYPDSFTKQNSGATKEDFNEPEIPNSKPRSSSSSDSRRGK